MPVQRTDPPAAVGPDPSGTGYAHAKAILLGEHAVVYGTPALAVPVHGLGVEARVWPAPEGVHVDSELFAGDASTAPGLVRPVVTALSAALDLVGLGHGAKVRILSSLPHERGLGSSAAVAAAVARAVAGLAGVELGPDALYKVVQEAERHSHGNPSGLDARAVVADTPIRFQRGRVAPVPVGTTTTFVLADSGMAGSTARSVAGVRERLEADPSAVERTFARIADLVEEGARQLAHGDLAALGTALSEDHRLLAWLGVSNEVLDRLVAAATAAGSAGAKLTGGGQGGCVIALADSEDHADELATALRGAGAARTWTTTVPAA
ncbi:mevalonate kinase [Ornithinimicrobium avium]|uniref:Mevalonate kinase n=1 Tax=Ornithinimicrobium avium TaxID=2283195 RepID=A0A345NRY9_9MICO|nr:mevalonate kinase [Ornithinimicrobium avium]